MRTVICFDISDDRKRYRVVKVLRASAERVQKAVFEARFLNQAAFLRMRSRLERIIDPATDSLRYYRLCETCLGRIEHYGAGPGSLEREDTFRIVGP